ncbi:flavodoxin [Halobacillus faecis]
MTKILIGFASMSGNTEDMADHLKSHLDSDFDVDMQELEDIEASSLLEYDGILIGSYTWNDGDLPYEVEDFYDDLADVDLTGIAAAVFGSGDPVYPRFCEAVHLLEDQLKASDAMIIAEGLKIEMNPDTEEDMKACSQFAERVSTHFLNVKT